MPYITYSGNDYNALELFKASKKFADGDSIVVRRGNKTIKAIAKHAMKLGFDTVIMLKFNDSKRVKINADEIKIIDVNGNYLWGTRLRVA